MIPTEETTCRWSGQGLIVSLVPRDSGGAGRMARCGARWTRAHGEECEQQEEAATVAHHTRQTRQTRQPTTPHHPPHTHPLPPPTATAAAAAAAAAAATATAAPSSSRDTHPTVACLTAVAIGVHPDEPKVIHPLLQRAEAPERAEASRARRTPLTGAMGWAPHLPKLTQTDSN